MLLLRVVRFPLAALGLLSLVVLVRAASGSPLAASVGRVSLGPLGTADVGLHIGVVEATLLTLVALVGTVVAVYSARNLVGQHRLVRYAALLTTTVGALALAVTASSLPVLAAAWTTGSLTLSALVAHSGTASAVEASRQVRGRLLVGDALLCAGVVVAGHATGTLDRGALAGAVTNAATVGVTAAALLFVTAGMVRSALVPAHRWLPETAEGPSPVSALLHAGFVNGVGVLALLVWPILQAAPVARGVLLVAGAATAALATGQLRTRADMKGRLAASTSSQMGYLAVQAAIGIPAGVLLHVVGHGIWKASLFLGAGGTVDRQRTGGTSVASAPGRPAYGPRWIAPTAVGASALLVAWTAVVPVAGWPSLTAPAELLPLGLAMAVTASGLLAVLRRRVPSGPRAFGGLVVVTVAATYVLVLRGLGSALAEALGEPTAWSEAGAGVLAVVAVGLLGLIAAGAALDAAARAGRRPGLSRRVARSALRPWSVRERLAGSASVGLAVPPVTVEDADAAASSVRVAAMTGGPLYPLTAFVASNPLAALESLPMDEAVSLSSELHGARTGPSARDLRDALATGRARDEDLDAVATEVALPAPQEGDSGTALLTVGTTLAVRSLLLADDPDAGQIEWAAAALRRAGVEPDRRVRTPLDVVTAGAVGSSAGRAAARIERRARELGHHACARSLAGAGWPGATGPWTELRAGADGLDAALRVRGAGEVVRALPAEPEATIAALLTHLGLRPQDRPRFIARVLARDPGWPAHLAWRARHERLAHDGAETIASRLTSPTAPHRLVEELVAARLALEVVTAEAWVPKLLGRPFDSAELVSFTHDGLAPILAMAMSVGLVHDDVTKEEVREAARLLAPLAGGRLGPLRAEVLERAYRRELLSTLTGAGAPGGGATAPDGGVATAAAGGAVARGAAANQAAPGPAAQLITCIDVRSERLRRHLEDQGPWETIGAAGFFGVPLRHHGPEGTVSERTPGLLRPRLQVTEQRPRTHGLTGTGDALTSATTSLEAAPGLPFAWAELAGWLQAPLVLASTLMPRLAGLLRTSGRRTLTMPHRGRLDVVEQLGVEALADAAAGFLASTGTEWLAPLVVIAGHGGTVTNNPHVAAYDCGACGGSASDVNARAMAAALEDPGVRAELAARGLRIPSGTHFVAAVHDTTRDIVEVLDRHEVPTSSTDVLRLLEMDLARAGEAVRSERLALLPDARGDAPRSQLRHVQARAADWAQPRPEWGLAGAATIIVGPRWLTERTDLRGRAFLQSYRPDLDPDASVLEQLLAAPVVVAQWITAQYWTSTVDPHRFGAGDKTTHNVIGDGARLSAVLTGVRGDLRIGLPWQAVSPTAPHGADSPAILHDGPWSGPTQHQPLRLLAVVCAEPAAVEQVLARQPDVARLVTGGWITLSVIDPVDGRALTRTRDGAWTPEGAGSPTPPRPAWDAG
ncbi:putative inorganic carbon transporter subunit DabA [Terrabacter tumescens]|nr:putative inorganic carbon transporter subunit DabA [Terrabacter tumescens]